MHNSRTTPCRQSITVAVVQQAREKELSENRDKIVGFIGDSKSRKCRLVIFPEDSLGSPIGTSNEEIRKALDVIQKATRSNDVYIILCASFPIPEFPPERRGHCLRVIDPEGRIIHEYNKLICNIPPSDPRRAPSIFQVDGIPCCAMICADRWLRGLEELPVTLGAKILIDCSANAALEWVPEFAWYLPVTRALRNNAYTIFCNMGEHTKKGVDEARQGHSAIINPDGTFAAVADETGDQMLVATLDMSRAHLTEAMRRHTHPVFQPFWDLGRRILEGEGAQVELPEPFTSPEVDITIAAAQMACSREISDNLERMIRMISEAKGNNADVVLFPELAVTGTIASDIIHADGLALGNALSKVQSEAQKQGIMVVFGMPHLSGSKRSNSAFIVGPNGNLMTRYDQIVVDRQDLFEPGTKTKPMWFEVKGVPAVVTIGADVRWNEIVELAAIRGAQLLFNLSYDPDTSETGTLRRTQFWVQFASFHTITATVNAADPQELRNPSTAANGGSAIWDDIEGHRKKPADDLEVFSQYSACRLASAGSREETIYGKRIVRKTNEYFRRFISQRYPHLEPWYHLGARIIGGDHDC